MTILRERDGIRYNLLEERDLEAAAQLVASVFADGSEPVTRVLRVGHDDFVRFVLALCPKFRREGISIVARDTRSGELAGVQLTDDMGTDLPDLAGVKESVAPALALLEELDRRYFGDGVAEPGMYAHLFFVAIAPEYCGARIASQLLELSLELASGKHYKKAIAEATGLVSQHVLRKAGFEPRVEIPYAEFSHNGRRPFQGITDHPSILLMEKDLKHSPIARR